MGKDALKNKIFVVYELGGLGNEGRESLEMMKQLLTEGCIKRQIADSTRDGVKGKLLEVDGPTALWTTTTKIVTDNELNNRLFKLTIDDSPEQTKKVVAQIFNEKRVNVDFEPFRALHTWLAAQDNRVTIPFGDALADKLPGAATRIRRDATRIKNLIRAHAVLHQATRERNTEGEIIATLEDYKVVRALVDNLIGVAAEKSVSPTVRETVERAKELISQGIPVTRTSLAKKLGIGKENGGRRLGTAKSGGFLKHDPDAEGSAKVYVLDEPLPVEKDILPTAEELQGQGLGDAGGAVVRENPGEGRSEADLGDAEAKTTGAPPTAPVHAPPKEIVGVQNVKPDIYGKYSEGTATATHEPGPSGNPVHPRTPPKSKDLESGRDAGGSAGGVHEGTAPPKTDEIPNYEALVKERSEELDRDLEIPRAVVRADSKGVKV